ncbi:MAG: DUF4143 domain-containing protein [Gammaproteobacteria bacterium]|nr:DUF4143 domain-containing protein [Gammaproteobacteria bacterium]
MEYLPRIVDAELSLLLEATGAVLIEGPKACGKTETALRAAASEVRLDRDENAKQMVDLDVGTVLAGETPRLIDEWQLAPRIWNHVRHEVDRRRAPGQFILTGSSKPADDQTRHSGAGRFSRLRMRPCALSESGQSSSRISLAKLLRGEPQSAVRQEMTIPSLAEIVCAGGWPANVGKPLAAAIRANRGYVREISHVDIAQAGGKSYDPLKVERLLRSLARNVATPAAKSKVAADVGGANGQKLNPDTAAEYLEALTRLMVVEDQPAWAPNLRSRTRLRAAAARHFVDPSLAVAALGITPDRLLADLEYFGFLFESLVTRDLRIYAQAADARVYHYREKDGLEVDAIVETADGRWAAFEIKLGERWIAEGQKNLLRLAGRLAETDHGKPAALAVIVPNGYGHFKPGEVGIVPINALGP